MRTAWMTDLREAPPLQTREVAHCPHCHAVLQADAPRPFPQRAMACPRCRLIVAEGRALFDVERAANTAVSGAGVMVNAARREQAEPIDPMVVAEALQEVAEVLGVAVAKLRMTDYEHLTTTRPDLPSLGQILATYDQWKAARAAADALGVEDDHRATG